MRSESRSPKVSFFSNCFSMSLEIEANETFLVQVGHFLFDELEKRRPNQFRDHSVVRRPRFFANLTDQWCGCGFAH